jgi:hypothetical protein
MFGKARSKQPGSRNTGSISLLQDDRRAVGLAQAEPGEPGEPRRPRSLIFADATPHPGVEPSPGSSGLVGSLHSMPQRQVRIDPLGIRSAMSPCHQVCHQAFQPHRPPIDPRIVPSVTFLPRALFDELPYLNFAGLCHETVSSLPWIPLITAIPMTSLYPMGCYSGPSCSRDIYPRRELDGSLCRELPLRERFKPLAE